MPTTKVAMSVPRHADRWPTVDIDAMDMSRAARQLLDDLGRERCADLVAALAEGCWPSDSPVVVNHRDLCEDCRYGVEELS
jgi:hypothetical protein